MLHKHKCLSFSLSLSAFMLLIHVAVVRQNMKILRKSRWKFVLWKWKFWCWPECEENASSSKLWMQWTTKSFMACRQRKQIFHIRHFNIKSRKKVSFIHNSQKCSDEQHSKYYARGNIYDSLMIDFRQQKPGVGGDWIVSNEWKSTW